MSCLIVKYHIRGKYLNTIPYMRRGRKNENKTAPILAVSVPQWNQLYRFWSVLAIEKATRKTRSRSFSSQITS